MSGHISGDKIVVVETRRRWSDEERQRAVDETRSLPVSVVARKHGIAKSLLFRWRKEAGLTGKRETSGAFVPVRIAAASPVASLPSPTTSSATADQGTIEIELAGGTRLKVSGTVRSDTLRQVIAALRA
jgi:transposase